MHKTLQLKPSDMIAEHLLQVYFMQGQENMLVTFCDSLDIPHNGKGQVEGSLPDTLDPDKLKTAIDALLEQHDARPRHPLSPYLQPPVTRGLVSSEPMLLSRDDRLQLS